MAKKKLNMAPILGIVGLLVVVGVGALFLSGSQGPTQDYSNFTACLTSKGIDMYGSITCSVCARQRAYFGDAFENVNEIECHPGSPGAQPDLCIEKDIEATPTWILEPNGVETNRLVGFQTAEELSQLSGCPLPASD